MGVVGSKPAYQANSNGEHRHLDQTNTHYHRSGWFLGVVIDLHPHKIATNKR